MNIMKSLLLVSTGLTLFSCIYAMEEVAYPQDRVATSTGQEAKELARIEKDFAKITDRKIEKITALQDQVDQERARVEEEKRKFTALTPAQKQRIIWLHKLYSVTHNITAKDFIFTGRSSSLEDVITTITRDQKKSIFDCSYYWLNWKCIPDGQGTFESFAKEMALDDILSRKRGATYSSRIETFIEIYQEIADASFEETELAKEAIKLLSDAQLKVSTLNVDVLKAQDRRFRAQHAAFSEPVY